MSLLASQALITNTMLRTRVEAAVRKTAAARLEAEGASGRLAQSAYRMPGDVVSLFMLRLATNADMTAEACPSCGHVEAVGDQPVDDTVEWIVGSAWAAIAEELHGSPDEPAPEEPTTT